MPVSKKKSAPDHLQEAGRHIGLAKRRIARLIALIQKLERLHHDTKQARQLLSTLQWTLRTMEEHHQTMIADQNPKPSLKRKKQLHGR